MATSDRYPYLTSNVLNQDFLDECHENLTNNLELVVEIDTPAGTIYISDRNKYVGSTFYEARTNFPIITRTIGEFLDSVLEFSDLVLKINNVDGKYNDIMPAGANYDGWIGRSVVVKLGLRDVASTYNTIFEGKITDQGGFQRDVDSFTIRTRNKFDVLNVEFPKAVFKKSVFPNLENDLENLVVPIVYGDFTTNVEENAASVLAFPVNGLDADVNGETSYSNPVQVVISENDNVSFDTTQVYLKRGDTYYLFNSADIQNVTNNRTFEVRQSGTTPAGVTLVEGNLYEFATGDRFVVKVKGKDLGAYDDNIISIARDILETHGGLVAGDFDSSWDTYRDKSTPAVSAISTFKARAWIQDPKGVLEYVLSLLEQVRVELFIDRNQKLKLTSLHLDEFESSPSFTVKNWDVVKDTFQPKIHERNNFNRAKAEFNFLPNRNQQYQETSVFRNEAAITQQGKEISKKIIFPNLYETTIVESQVEEMLRLASGIIEIIDLNLTWRSMLLDIGDFVKINVSIQSTVFDSVPAMIRDIGADPDGLKIPAKIWSFQMLPFPGWTPGYSGTVGGSTATITRET